MRRCAPHRLKPYEKEPKVMGSMPEARKTTRASGNSKMSYATASVISRRVSSASSRAISSSLRLHSKAAQFS